MAKAYAVPATDRHTEYFCSECDEWSDSEGWDSQTAYAYYQPSEIEVNTSNGHVYYPEDESNESTLYESSCCSTWYDEEDLQSREISNQFECGVCRSRFSDKQEAVDCCQ